MTKVPSLNFGQVIKNLRRNGGVVARQKDSHIRLHKHTAEKILKLTVPAHKPLKRSTLSHILKQTNLSVNEFLKLMQKV